MHAIHMRKGALWIVLIQWCHPKIATRWVVLWEYVDHILNHAHFCMHDNNLLVKPVYVKV